MTRLTFSTGGGSHSLTRNKGKEELLSWGLFKRTVSGGLSLKGTIFERRLFLERGGGTVFETVFETV